MNIEIGVERQRAVGSVHYVRMDFSPSEMSISIFQEP